MAGSSTIRLNKVLRELNISLDRAVDYLASVGHEVEARPTAKISGEVHQLLLDKFQTDKSRKVASKEAGEKKRREEEKLRLQVEQEKLVRAQESEAKVIRGKAEELSGLKIVGNVDAEQKPEAPEPEDTPVAEESPETPVAPTESTEAPPSVTEVEQKEAPSAPPEEPTVLRTKRQLKGLTFTGRKIDLPQKPVSSSTSSSDRKKRRKRIVSKNVSQSGGGNRQNRGIKKGNQRARTARVEPTEEEVQKQVRETLEKLQGKSNRRKGAKYRRDKRDQHRQQTEKDLEQQELENKTLKVTEFVTVSEVATMMEVPTTKIISACMSLGIMVTLNQRLDAETISIVAEEFGYEVEFVSAEIEEAFEEEVSAPEDLKPRAPIVTVMGHVDHGKTSLLDYIREENVIAGESGGITQHIGAYGVSLDDGQRITFLDTPGHEAFTAMRARGAQVTDVAIIVIAADDAIMPQTKEAISHAQAAGVPIVFAINKIDKPTANPDKIKEGLAAMNLLVEDWGGKIQSHDISAKTGQGVKELLEKVLLEAELLELKADPNRLASGTVVEAFLDKGRGYVATVLVQSGTLAIGDYVLAGTCSGKVKAMQDERSKIVAQAQPAVPISILGLDGAPQAGDRFRVLEDEREAKQIAAKRAQLQREQSVRTQRHITLDEIGRRIALGDFQELKIILKGDVDGSVEALSDSFQKLSTEAIQVHIIHKGVGAITESDVLLASASDAIIIGFNVRPMGNARTVADREEIDIRLYSIIYDAINDLKDAMEGMLSPEIKEEITGTAEIREIFKISKIGAIAGCMVTQGKLFRNSQVRLIRDGVVIYTGVLASLKRFKDDVKEVAKGYDCGLQIKNYNDIKEGDTVEAFQEVAVKKKL